MKTVALVSCVKSKRDEPLCAADLYDSTWFRKARAYAEAQSDCWRILSAKHGLVVPDQVIAPYNMTLHDFSAERRREWAECILEALDNLISPEDTVIILAGRRYREYLVEPLRQRAGEVTIPWKDSESGSNFNS